MRIAIDVMSGDLGAEVPVAAALRALNDRSDITQILLVGDQTIIQQQLNQLATADAFRHTPDQISVLHADHVVDMAARPADVLRQKRDTSMLLALKEMQSGRADCCISAGNTGALVGLSRHLFGLLPGVKRLAICTRLPTSFGETYLLDIGANVDCDGEQLHQFACMGAALVASLRPGDLPRVRALSIGAEAGKGNQAVNEAEQLCNAENRFRFDGLIEANQLLSGECDVIFCDGFAGNIALKACEGTAQYIRALASESVTVPAALVDAIDPEQFNGAYLLGLKQLVVKSHGSSDEVGFAAAIDKAATACASRLVDNLANTFAAANPD